MSLKSIVLHSLRIGHSLAGHLPPAGRFRPVRGTFSAYERLLRGELEGSVLAERQEPGICPPGSMTEKAAFRQHDHQPWPIFWTKADKARLVGRMLHWRDEDDRLCSEGVFHLKERRRLAEDKWSAQLLVPPAEKLPGAWINILSNWNDGGNYFHWMLDGLTRLLVWEQLPEPTKFFLPRNPPGFVLETIRLLGLEKFAIPAPADAIEPETFYFCSPTAMTGVLNPLGFDWLRGKFSSYFSIANSAPPVFLTRRGGARVPESIGEIERLFESSGFEVVDCGAISVEEQIRKISAAPAVAGLHGAAMTNLLWARPTTPVLELFEPNYLNGCYEQIAFHGNLQYTHMTNQGDSFPESIQNWITDSAGAKNFAS